MSVERIEFLEKEIEEIKERIESVTHKFEDNGQPGISTRIDRLERAEATRSKLLWIIAASVVCILIKMLFNITL